MAQLDETVPESAPEGAAAAAEAGIHQLAVPTPFAIGAVNAYLIEGSPLTLVDTGPNTGTALVELERLLAELGHRVEDLERLVVTHHHLDHVGLTHLVAHRSGAEVVAMRAAAPFLAEYEREWRADQEWAAALMRRHGVEAGVIEALAAVAGITRSFGGHVEVTHPVDDGETLPSEARSLQVHFRPGHSSTDIVLHDRDARILVVGDHLLLRVSSNALVARALGAPPDSPRPATLLDYRRSLRKTRELGADVALGGHGPPIVDPGALVDRRLAQQEDRAQRLLELVRERRASARELAEALFGRVAPLMQTFLTISEVLGHLDMLIADGLVVEDDSGEVTVFEPA